jgi:hypothetical protein
MAMPLTLDEHVLDELLTLGEWCPHCQLPSALRLPFAVVDHVSLRPIIRGVTVVCQDCGRHWNEAAA